MDILTYMLDIGKYYDLIKNENIILSHQGPLDGDLIDSLIQSTDKKLTQAKTRLRTKKKIINILIECLQNSFYYTEEFRHVANKSTLVNSPYLYLFKKQGEFVILTGNYVTYDRAQFLKHKIDQLCEMTGEELTAYYVKSLNKDELPTKGGAGLGLVDIMRRANHEVNFDFKKIDEQYLLFSLIVKIA